MGIFSLFTGEAGKYGRLRKEINKVSREAMSLIPDACLYELADTIYGVAEMKAMRGDNFTINIYHEEAKFLAEHIALLVLKDKRFKIEMGDIYDGSDFDWMTSTLNKYNLA